MKKRLNLQRFADENDDIKPDIDDDGKAAENGDNEPTEPEKKYTDAELDEIINKKFAKWKAKEEEAVKAAREEAEKLAKMNAEQKQQYKLEQLEEENAQLKAAATRLELSKEATSLLKEQKVDATAEMLELVVTDSAETTKANIEKLVNIINASKAQVEKDHATGKPPAAYSGDSDKTITKAEFARMTYQEVRDLKANNPELYKKLTEG